MCFEEQTGSGAHCKWNVLPEAIDQFHSHVTHCDERHIRSLCCHGNEATVIYFEINTLNINDFYMYSGFGRGNLAAKLLQGIPPFSTQTDFNCRALLSCRCAVEALNHNFLLASIVYLATFNKSSQNLILNFLLENKETFSSFFLSSWRNLSYVDYM